MLFNRSLGRFPCDKEYGLLFESPHKIKAFLNKLWNHRLNTNCINYSSKQVFDLVSNNTWPL